MIALPARGTDEGTEVRLLLAECRGPASAGYTLRFATKSMGYMDLVLWNRVKHPKPFLAHAATLLAVVKARGQFQGFENYPNYSAKIVLNIQQAIDIANNSRDKRSADYQAFIGAALAIVNAANTVPDPSPQGFLASWRTAGSGSPGSNFTYVATVLGNDFYSFQ